MKYLDAHRDPRAARELIEQIGRIATRPWTLVEVCGGQAHNLLRLGADLALPPGLDVVHGPGCPISALPDETLRRAIAIAAEPGVILCTPGDLLRVPSGRDSLQAARARGLDVRVVYSPLDALSLARKHPEHTVVMLAVGFETTAPPAAAALIEADRLDLPNLAFLTGFFRVEAAVEALLAAPGQRARAALVPGPVCSVTGLRGYESMAERLRVPLIVTGPEPVDLLDAILRAVKQLEAGAYAVENQYARAVRPDGNPHARASIDAVFEPADADWRGQGRIAGSGLALREPFLRFDAARRFAATPVPPAAPADCRDGDVLAGRIKPPQCPSFGGRCSPDHPLGAAMVSPEGPCAAYHRYRRTNDESPTPADLPVIPTPAIPGASS